MRDFGGRRILYMRTVGGMSVWRLHRSITGNGYLVRSGTLLALLFARGPQQWPFRWRNYLTKRYRDFVLFEDM